MPALTGCPILTDGTVTLRAHRPEDAQGALEQSLDPLSQRWTTVPIPYSMDDARRFVTEIMPRGWDTNEEWGFAVEYAGRYGGTMSLRNRGEGRAEVAYGSHPAIRGTGAMERGLRLLLEWGFRAMELENVAWWANRGNWASRKLAHRVGFSFDGTVRRWLPHRQVLVDGWVGTLLRGEALEPRTTWLDCPVVEGHGVRLRPIIEADVPRVVDAISDPETQHWLSFLPSTFSESEGHAYVETVHERLAEGTGVTWAISDDGEYQGTIGLFRIEEGRKAELGYFLHPAARGRALASRGSLLALRHAFETLGVPRVTAYVSAPNTASLRVLDRLGMRRTGVERKAARTRTDEPVDLVGYDLLAEEWPEVWTRWSRADQRSTATPTTDRAAPSTAGER